MLRPHADAGVHSVLEFVASANNYILYRDTRIGNYKIHNGEKIVANPSTEEDAYRTLRMYANKILFSDAKRCWTQCTATTCDDCERYVW